MNKMTKCNEWKKKRKGAEEEQGSGRERAEKWKRRGKKAKGAERFLMEGWRKKGGSAFAFPNALRRVTP